MSLFLTIKGKTIYCLYEDMIQLIIFNKVERWYDDGNGNVCYNVRTIGNITYQFDCC